MDKEKRMQSNILFLLLLLDFASLVWWLVYPTSATRVRIHSDIIWRAGAWIRLWYFLRGLDKRGRGRVDVPLFVICEFLKTKESTIYEWLRIGRSQGGFRRYCVRKGHLRVYLGGLHSLCENLNLDDWGATTVCSLEEVDRLSKIKHEAAAATADRGQIASLCQQRRQLTNSELKYYKKLFPDDIFEQVDREPSAKPERGAIPCVLWIGKKKIFVDAGFLPFGKKQASIAEDLGVSISTVQRALKGKDRRQIVQTKTVYHSVLNLFKFHSEGFPEREVRPGIHFQIDGSGTGYLSEPIGQSSVRIRRMVKPGRVFEYGNRAWLCHCNVYRPTAWLASMARSRNNFQMRLKSHKDFDSLVQLMIQNFRAAWKGWLDGINKSYLKGGLLRTFEKFFFLEEPGNELHFP